MKLGIGSYAFAWNIGVPGYTPAVPMDIFSFIKTVAAAEVNLVQIADNLPLHQLSPHHLKQLIELCNTLSIEVEVGTRGLYVERVREYIELAHQLGSPFLRLVVVDSGYEPELKQIVQDIKKLMPILKDRNVILAIENHDRFKARELAQVVENTDATWVGICLDTANSLGAGEGIEEAMQHLGPYTVNLHVKDVKIQRVPSNMGFKVMGCPAGQGIIDVPGLLKRLSGNANFFSVTLEVWSDLLPDIEQTIARERDWVVSSIKYLKEILTDRKVES